MQARVDVVMCLHERLQANLAGTAQQRIIGANVEFDIALPGLVMPFASVKVRIAGCRWGFMSILYLFGIAAIVKKSFFRLLRIERVRQMILLCWYLIFTWHASLLPLLHRRYQ